MGVFDGFRRRQVSAPSQVPVVGDLASQGEVRWSQPLHWGLLLAFDCEAEWEMPANLREGVVAATPSCLAVPVLHSSDVEMADVADPDALLPEAEVEVVITSRPLQAPKQYIGTFRCPSGQLEVGDGDESRIVTVPPGDLAAEVRLEPQEHAERVWISLRSSG